MSRSWKGRSKPVRWMRRRQRPSPRSPPRRTLSGVAGYETTFELTVYHSRVAGAEELKRKVVRALDDLPLQTKVCRYRSAQSDYFPQYDLHSYTLTFRII